MSLGVPSWLPGLVRVFREFRGQPRGAGREGLRRYIPRNHPRRNGRGYIGNASSVLIRVHPWLLTPRSDSEGLSFVSLGVPSWLPGLVRVFREFRGQPRGARREGGRDSIFRAERPRASSYGKSLQPAFWPAFRKATSCEAKGRPLRSANSR